MTIEMTIAPLVVPISLDADDAADFRAYGALGRQICDEMVGIADLAPAAEQMITAWRDTRDTLHTGFVAKRGGETVGMVTIDYAQEDGARAAELDLLVPAENWGQGIETALLDHAESAARRHGRSILQIWSLHRTTDAARSLVPGTGWGRIPAIPLTDLLEERGFRLEQVERNSELDLTADTRALDLSLQRAMKAAAGGYRLLTWDLPTPPEFRDGYAQVLSRLTTDAPSGDMEFDEEAWDAARVARRDARLTGAGQLVSVAAIEHVPSGAIVAYNELLIGADRTGITHQFGTLVASEHRGHRLGTWVKCANLLRWRERVPDSPRVSTFNAEENRPMLDINEAIGFVPVSYAGAWQKKI